MKSNPTIFLIAIALVLAGGAYWYFSTRTGNEPPLTPDIKENQAQMQFKTLVSKLPTEFDTDIFSNPNFTALADLATQVTPEPSGRLDPFAPIAGVSAK